MNRCIICGETAMVQTLHLFGKNREPYHAPCLFSAYVNITQAFSEMQERLSSLQHTLSASDAMNKAKDKRIKSLETALTPPPDAEVREAVEAAEECIRVGGWGHLFNEDHLHIVIRALIRAVQAPRLTREQLEAVNALVAACEGHEGLGDTVNNALEALRSAFAEEAFEVKEVGE